jgi:hypothetical protein
MAASAAAAASTMYGPHEELGLRVLRSFHAPSGEKDDKDGPSPGLYTIYAALLHYKFIEYRILARVLGLSEAKGTIAGRDSKGEVKVKECHTCIPQ